MSAIAPPSMRNGSERGLTLLNRAGVHCVYHGVRQPVGLLREVLDVRDASEYSERTQVVAGLREMLVGESQDLHRARRRIEDEADHHVRADRVQPVLDQCDDTEPGSSAMKRPEEIGVLARARRDDVAASGHDLEGDEVVAREPVLPPQPADAAAEREPGDTRPTDDAERRREAELLRRRRRARRACSLRPRARSARRRPPRSRSGARGRRPARRRTPTSRRRCDRLLARTRESRAHARSGAPRDVARVGHARHERRPPVDEAVQDLPSLGVGRIPRPDSPRGTATAARRVRPRR